MREQIIKAARECIGTPFRHQGRIPGRALDCAGLAVVVFRRLGFDVVDVQGYSRLPHRGRLKAAIEAQPFIERVHDEMPGDVLLIRVGSEPTHIAIDAGGTMIHAYEHVGKVCEHVIDKTWRDGIVARYRVKQ